MGDSPPPTPRHRKTHWIFHRSPLYLHVKLYTLTALVSLFVARPLTDKHDGLIHRAQQWVDEARQQRGLPVNQSRLVDIRSRVSDVKRRFEDVRGVIERGGSVAEVRDVLGRGSTAPPPRWKIVLRRWRARFGDLVTVDQIEQAKWANVERYPEIERVARVRTEGPSPEEAWVRARRQTMLPHCQRLFPSSTINAADLPLIAVGGSGGGFRAMLGYAAFLDALQTHKIWDLLTWTSGVSGSCWTLASLYTHCEHSGTQLLEHYRRVTSEQLHPMSLQAFDLVARSRRGNAFLFGPLVRKSRLLGHRGGGGSVMDLYATLTTSYLLLPRHELTHTSPNTQGISESVMGWSKIRGIDNAQHPLPILTAVRVAIDEPTLPMQWWEFSPLESGTADIARGAFIPTWSFGRQFSSGQSITHAPEIPLSLILGHCTSAPAGPLTGYISALLATIPTGTVMSWILGQFNAFLRWKVWRKRWGNPIRSSKEWNPWFGLRIGSEREIKMQRFPSVNNTESKVGVRTEMATTQIQVSTVDTGSRVGGRNEVKKEMGTTPIRLDTVDTISEPIATPGHATSAAAQVEAEKQSQNPTPTPSSSSSTDTSRKLKLMDAGVSNNLPAHIFASTQHRTANIFIAFDASSDVQSPLALERVLHFGQERGLEFHFAPESQEVLGNTALADYIQQQRSVATGTDTQGTWGTRFAGRYAVVLDGYEKGATHPHPRMTYIYCPLLPHDSNPTFDPATAEFSTSYNLVWEKEQAESVFRTVSAAVEEEVVSVVSEVVRRWVGVGV